MKGEAKTFHSALEELRERLARREPHALARYGDGEMEILRGTLLEHQRFIVGHEYQFRPDDPEYAACRKRLLESFRYRHPSYYVGISCPHCVGHEGFEWLRRTSGQDEEHLTWATLFFYSNYPRFLESVVPLFAQYEVVLVCPRTASLERLPFPVMQDFRVGTNAWRDDYGLVATLTETITARRLKGALFLFCAGPFGGILAHRLHAFCPENTYLDLGSPLDPFFFPDGAGRTRRYLKNEALLEWSCYWDGGVIP